MNRSLTRPFQRARWGTPLLALVALTACGDDESKRVLESLQILPDQAELSVDETQQFIALGRYSDGTSDDLTLTVTWSSSDDTILGVANNGLAAAKAPGSVTVGAAFDDISATEVPVTVTAVELAGIRITPSELDALHPGDTVQLIALADYDDGSSRDVSGDASWTSAPPSIASVDAHGVVTAHAAGDAVIGASFGGRSAELTAHVIVPSLTGLEVMPGSVKLPLGSSQQFVCLATYDDASQRDLTEEVVWRSDDEEAVIVNADGLGTAVGEGFAKITCEQGEVISPVAGFQVLAGKTIAVTIDPSHTTLVRGSGAAVQLSATALDWDGTELDVSSTAIWRSSDDDVVVVDADGTVSAGTETGLAVVTAEYDGVTSHDAAVLVVASQELVGLEVSAANDSVHAGFALALTATGTFRDGRTEDLTLSVDWSIAGDGSAAMEPHGVLRAIAPGAITVTASLAGIEGTKDLTIDDATLQVLHVDPATLTLADGESSML